MKILGHLSFWLVVFGMLLILFGRSFNSYIETFYFVSILLPVILSTSYFFNYYLVPIVLMRKRYWHFLLYTTYMIVISFYLEMLAIIFAYIYLANYRLENLGPIFGDVLFLAIALYFVVLIKGFVLLIRNHLKGQQTIYSLREENKRNENTHLLVKVDRKNTRIMFDDIWFFESLADYVRIHTSSKGIVVTKKKIGALSSELPRQFVRIHRSFTVNTVWIDSFNRNEILIKNKTIPISRTYKKNALEVLNENA